MSSLSTNEPIEKQYLDFPPRLIVEILSDATRLKDRQTKYSWYEKAGVKYYLNVDADEEIVEIYRFNTAGKYELIHNDEVQELTDDCNLNLDVSQFWV